MHIGIIGSQYKGLKAYLDANDIEYTLFKDSRKKVNRNAKNTVHIDFSDTNVVINTLKEFSSSNSLDGVFTFYERYIVVTAKIAESLNLLGLSTKSSLSCTNKFIMRTDFSKSTINISPDFCVVESIEDLESFSRNHQFPLILKPANLAKSLLVSKCHSIDELLNTYKSTLKIIDSVYEKYAPDNERILILEEFMEGSIHSVDAFIDSEGNSSLLDIVDYRTGYDVGYNDNFHYSRIIPSKLNEKNQEALKSIAKEGVKSLGMTNTAAHIEVIMTSKGPKIVEIGARNGGYRERMHMLSDGIDIYGNLIAVTTGLTDINVTPSKHEYCAVLEIFPKFEGTFKGISFIDELKKLSSLNYINVKYNVGDKAGFSSNGFKAALVIALHNNDQMSFEKDLKFVENNVFVKIE